VFDSALAAAHALPLAQRQAQLPQLVLQAAQMEVDAADSEVVGRLAAGRTGGQQVAGSSAISGSGGGVGGAWAGAAMQPLCRAFHMLLWLLNGGCSAVGVPSLPMHSTCSSSDA
jgi:hypothetical protein